MTSLSNLAKLSKYRHFNHEIIILWVQWYVSYKLSYRNLVELMAERGVELARTHAGGLEHRASVRSLLYTGFVEPLEHRVREVVAPEPSGGEGGIRTHDTLARIPVFETGLFNRSSTSPEARILPRAPGETAAVTPGAGCPDRRSGRDKHDFAACMAGRRQRVGFAPLGERKRLSGLRPDDSRRGPFQDLR